MKILGQFCLSKCTERYTCAFLVKCNFFPLRYCSHCSTALQNYFVFDMLPWHMKVNNDLLSQPSDKWRESIVNVQKHTAKPDKTRHKNDSRTTLFHCFKQFLLPLYYHYFLPEFFRTEAVYMHYETDFPDTCQSEVWQLTDLPSQATQWSHNNISTRTIICIGMYFAIYVSVKQLAVNYLPRKISRQYRLE